MLKKLENFNKSSHHRNMSEVLVSFDGSTPGCIEDGPKSRNLFTTENENHAGMLEIQPKEHPKVNLPFFRNNRNKKIKVFNLGTKKSDYNILFEKNIHQDTLNNTSTCESEK